MSKISQQNNLETVTIEYNKGIPKERQNISTGETENCWWSEINIIA